MIAHEDSLANSRANWLILIQGLLFAAFSGLEDNVRTTIVLAAVGIVVSLSFFISLKTNEKAIGNLLAFWDRHLQRTAESWEDYPPVIGIGLHRKGFFSILDRFVSPRKILPWAFTLAWIIIGVLSVI